jgi:hypothetical protein
MNLITYKTFAMGFVLLGTTVFVHGQTSSELRARYGEPQMTELKNNRPAVERFLVRPDILMTIRYTDRGEPCEASFKPVPNSTQKTGLRMYEDDHMSTCEVIKLINEILPDEKRGKKTGQGQFNGGDPQMKLHHPGCTGFYFVYFENAWVDTASSCLGGTFSAVIHWGKPPRPEKRSNSKERPSDKSDVSCGGVFLK